MSHELLSTLGLCKRAGMLAAGEEPVESVARARDARLLLLACDAADNTARRVAHFAEMGQCLWVKTPFTKEELGRAVGTASCAVMAVTDIGFASSIARRMADEDETAYGETAKRLEIKAQRAALRKTEEALHEKNLRKGKKRVKGESKAAEKPPEDLAEKPSLAEKSGGNRKPYNSGRKPYSRQGDRKPYGGKPGTPGGRKPYGGKPGAPGGRKPYGGKPGAPGDRKPYGGKPGTPGDRKPYGGKPGTPGDRKPYGSKPGAPGDRKPYGGKPGTPGARKPYGSKPGAPGDRKPYGGKPGAPGDRKPYGGKPGTPGNRKPYDKPDPYAHSHPVKHGKGSAFKKKK